MSKKYSNVEEPGKSYWKCGLLKNEHDSDGQNWAKAPSRYVIIFFFWFQAGNSSTSSSLIKVRSSNILPIFVYIFSHSICLIDHNYWWYLHIHHLLITLKVYWPTWQYYDLMTKISIIFILNLVSAYLKNVSFLNIRPSTQNATLELME